MARELTRINDVKQRTFGDLKLIHLTEDVYDRPSMNKTGKPTIYGVFKCKCGRKRIVNINTVLYAKEGSTQLKCIHQVLQGNAFFGIDPALVHRFSGLYTRVKNSDEGTEWNNISEFYDDMFLKFYATYLEAQRNDKKNIRFDRYDQSRSFSKDNMYFYFGSIIRKGSALYDDLKIDGHKFSSLYEVATTYNMDISKVYRRYKRGLRGNDLII